MRISDWSSDVCSSDLPPRSGEERQQSVESRLLKKFRAAAVIIDPRGGGGASVSQRDPFRISGGGHSLFRRFCVKFPFFCFPWERLEKMGCSTHSYIPLASLRS